ncbi:unnamed protein product, partial [Prorocentrum cordatum]
EVTFALESGETGSTLLEKLLPKYRSAKDAKEEDTVKALEMVCPELADALKPVPPKAPEVLLEQHAACLRRLQCQQEKLKNQVVANARSGKELLLKLEENVRACAETQAEVNRLTSQTSAARGAGGSAMDAGDGGKTANTDESLKFPELDPEDVALLTPEQQTAYEAALARAKQAQEVYKNAQSIGQQAQDAAKTLRELRETATHKRRRASGAAGVAAGAPAAGAESQAKDDEKPVESNRDFTDVKNVEAHIQRTASIKARAAEVKKFVESAPYDLMGMAEHHLSQVQCQGEERRLRNVGWRSEATWTAATATGRSEKGTHGGTCWLRRATYATSTHLTGSLGKSAFHDALRDTTVVLWRFHGVTFAFIVCYLDCSIGMAGTNSRKMHNIARIVKSLDVPWLLVGDFNATPAEMAKSGWLDVLRARVVTTEGVEVSCTSGKGRMIDYAVVPDSFRPFLSQVLPVQNLPWGPHIGLNILIRSRPASVFLRVPVLPVPLVIPEGESRVPKGLKRFQRDREKHAKIQEMRDEMHALQQGGLLNDDDDHLLDDHYVTKRALRCDDQERIQYVYEASEDLGYSVPQAEPDVQRSEAYRAAPHMSEVPARQYGIWSMAAEAQLADLCEVELRQGARRGMPVKYQWRRAVVQKNDSNFGHSSANALSSRWASLHARVQEQLVALGRFRHSGYRQRVQDIVTSILAELRREHDRHGPVPDGHAEDLTGKWRVFRDDEQVLRQGERIRACTDFAEWQNFALKVQARSIRHASLAGQQTRSEIGSWAVKSAQGSMKGAHRYLKKNEQRALDETCIDPVTGEVCDTVQGTTDVRAACWAARTWPTFHTREQLVATLKSFPKGTGTGPDQWKPAHILALSDQGQEYLVTLFNMIERGLAWPHQLLHNWFALLPKGEKQELGNERDIGLLPMPVKIWGRLTKTPLTEWCDKRAAHWDAAVRGSSALQAALLTMVLDETRARIGLNEQNNFLADVEKFYEHMDLAQMILQAIELQFPAVELYLCCLTYLPPRTVKAQGAYAESIVPNCSIVPGCGKANHCARVFLYRLLERAHERAPLAHIRQHVDDVHTRVEGPRKMVLDQTKIITCELAQGMLDLGLRVSPKSLLMMTNVKDEVRVQRHVLQSTGIKIKRASWAKDLGVDCSMGIKRATKTAKGRMTTAQARATRTALFRRVGRGGSRSKGVLLHNTNIKAKFRYADPVLGVATSDMERRRAQAADLAGHAVGGRCTASVMLLHYQDDEAKMSVVKDQVKQWFQFWEAHPEMRERVRRGWRAVLKRLIYLRPRSRWRCVTGPMGALIMTLRELGWTPRAPDHWLDDHGNEWKHMGDVADSYDELYEALCSSVRRDLWKQAGDHPAGQGLHEGGDMHMLRVNLR